MTSARFMRIMLFFDLPTITATDRKEYRKFIKMLTKEGYIMMQESVYTKLCTNYVSTELEINKIMQHKPAAGLVQCLVVTEKQYSGIINITGELTVNKCNSTDRMIVL